MSEIIGINGERLRHMEEFNPGVERSPTLPPKDSMTFHENVYLRCRGPENTSIYALIAGKNMIMPLEYKPFFMGMYLEGRLFTD
tara:strand:+ start:539 stop:790 length:252 start_codon:yes stop_codon:yes gene_type:complete